MAVNVQIFGYLRLLLNREAIRLDWKGGTLGQMIDHMTACHDKAMGEELLDAQGALDRAYVIFVNGQAADDLTCPVEDGAEVVINSMMGGG